MEEWKFGNWKIAFCEIGDGESRARKARRSAYCGAIA
jgi:hypothetical protein